MFHRCEVRLAVTAVLAAVCGGPLYADAGERPLLSTSLGEGTDFYLTTSLEVVELDIPDELEFVPPENVFETDQADLELAAMMTIGAGVSSKPFAAPPLSWLVVGYRIETGLNDDLVRDEDGELLDYTEDMYAALDIYYMHTVSVGLRPQIDDVPWLSGRLEIGWEQTYIRMGLKVGYFDSVWGEEYELRGVTGADACVGGPYVSYWFLRDEPRSFSGVRLSAGFQQGTIDFRRGPDGNWDSGRIVLDIAWCF